jgi:L-ascorbate metabolism protein UlaG (beta-lactamase superfamily)
MDVPEKLPQFRFRGRRAFVAGGLAATAGGVGWASLSSSWAARFVRERLSEFGRDVPAATHTPAPATWKDNAITLAWLGHATVLINFYGVRILTDPTLFDRIGVDLGVGSLGPLRQVRCALTPAQLPEIDLVLVSHAHFDHLDTPSLGAVRGRPAAVTAADVSDLLPRRRYSSIHELRWDQRITVRTSRGDVHVRSIEVQHWGARLQTDTYRGWTGFIVEREGKRLLIAGDTAQTPLFRSHSRYGPFEAAIMPIGAYDPWIWNHCTPEQAVAMADAAGARLVVPVHHQTFRLSREGYREPIERAEAALAGEQGRLAVRTIGETTLIT